MDLDPHFLFLLRKNKNMKVGRKLPLWNGDGMAPLLTKTCAVGWELGITVRVSYNLTRTTHKLRYKNHISARFKIIL
jgi:hypothetical protein